MRSSRLLAAGLLLCTTGVAVAQASASTPSPDSAAFFQEASDCPAAYKAGVTARLAQPKTEARDKAILEDTERSFVFIGVAYKQGLRKPWKVHQNYALDLAALRLGKVEDGVMQFGRKTGVKAQPAKATEAA